MTEKDGGAPHSNCSQCKCQCINDDEHIKMIMDLHDWGNDIKHAPHVERGKRKKQSRQQTIINSLSNANEYPAPTPLPCDYILNINTLNGETFSIKG